MHAAPHHPLLRALFALSLLALATATAAQTGAGAATQPYAIDTPESAGGAQAGWKLSISGAWPTQCPPTLEGVAVEGMDLRVDARSVLGLCARHATPFSIEVDPALALERPALAAGIYHVSFFAADGAQAAPRLRAFSLVDHSPANAPAVNPETGFWWSTAGADRNVISIELQNAQISVALMSYDAAGQPLWHFGAAPYAGHVAHVPLLRLHGGSDPFAATGAPSASGESTLVLDLEFHTAAHASAWLSRLDGGSDDATLRLRAFDLVRLPLAETADGGAWQGDWVLVEPAGAQRIHFDRFNALDADHFELSDTAQDIALTCTRDAKFSELPPSSCALRRGSDGAAALFDSVAISRMDGNTGNGIAMHLLRVSN